LPFRISRPIPKLEAMAHAIELLFDPTSEATVRNLWAQLEQVGLPSLATRTHRRHRPHVSLSVAERIQTGQLQGASERLAATHLDLTLHSAAIFPRKGVLYLSVVPTSALLRLHEHVQAALRDSTIGLRDTYAVDAWIPHCTLAQGLTRAQIARAIDLLHDLPQPVLTAHVISVGLLDTATGDVLPLADLQPHP
jgi:2'-5' RNA ligase